MTEPTGIDALIAEVRERFKDVQNGADFDDWERLARLAPRLADALESTTAELRQEQERVDEAQALVAFAAAIVSGDVQWEASEALARTRADLARAREVIEKARTLSDFHGPDDDIDKADFVDRLDAIIYLYDKNGSSDG